LTYFRIQQNSVVEAPAVLLGTVNCWSKGAH
jgi:hypothetical protein